MNTPALSFFKSTLLATTALILAACASSSSGGSVPAGYYRVKQGDTLYQVAKRHGQSVSTIAAWNKIPPSSKLEIGQVLRISRNAAAAPSSGTRNVAPTNRLNLQWPADNGRQSVIQRYNGSTSKGIDIAGNLGQPVKSAAPGKVIYTGDGVRGYGKLVLISHNTATITAYAHNDSILVQPEQTVRAGQTIATMGNSDTDRVKLHFEVRINGKAVDPMPHLAQ